MRTFGIVMLAVLAAGPEANGQQPGTSPTVLLELQEAGVPHRVGVRVTVDNLPHDEYWTNTFDAIFAFADCNSDHALSEDEVRLIPSARAVRLSLGSAFTPPVASIRSLKEILTNSSQTCSKEDLRNYYRRHGAGQLQFGYGKLPDTAAITDALVRGLDRDQDGRLSQAELLNAERTLRPLDTNDDELIGIGELVPNKTYPGNWATNALQPSMGIDLSPTGDRSLTLKLIPISARVASPGSAVANDRRSETNEPALGDSVENALWKIDISDQVHNSPLKVATNACCESWSIHGPLTGHFARLREEIADAEGAAPNVATENGSRNRRSSREWLTPLVDRDRDGQASQAEIDRWLALQRQLIHGQLLISVYHGGGLFELLDANHDAGLSVRELRAAWQTLKSAGCTSEGHVEVGRIPNVVFFVASQGFPGSLARPSLSGAKWFRLMDRNADGDVSRREFTGSPEAFQRLDQDRDNLISSDEAATGP